jgi:hypothetical protein
MKKRSQEWLVKHHGSQHNHLHVTKIARLKREILALEADLDQTESDLHLIKWITEIYVGVPLHIDRRALRWGVRYDIRTVGLYPSRWAEIYPSARSQAEGYGVNLGGGNCNGLRWPGGKWLGLGHSKSEALHLAKQFVALNIVPD